MNDEARIYQPARARVLRGEVRTGEVTTRVHGWGAPGAHPVWLLHGWGDCAATWQFVVDRLPGHWSLFAPDWRGFGESGHAPGGYWIPQYLADLDALLRHFAPDAPVTLVGHSLGGNVATVYAGVRPERVARVVSLEGFGLPDSDPAATPERYAQWLDQLEASPAFATYANPDALARRLMQRHPHLPRAHARFVAGHWTRRAPDGRVALLADPAHRRRNPVPYRRAEAEACWRRVRAPVLFVRGADSQLYPPEVSDLGQAAFADLRETTLPDCGHMLHWERPDAVARLIGDFVAG